MVDKEGKFSIFLESDYKKMDQKIVVDGIKKIID